MKTVWIVQPYVPTYRVPLFDRLSSLLSESGITLRIAAGTPSGNQAARGDAVVPGWITPISIKRVGPAVFARTWPLVRKADAVIYPHMGSWIELNRALGRPFKRGPRVGVWGHIASYVGPANPVDAAIERWQLRRADHVFSYTSGGAIFARGVGVAEDLITVLNNTFDTEELEAEIRSITATDVDAFEATHKISQGKTVAYIGGLDTSKRIDLLAEALDALWDLRPTVRVLIGGKGADSALLQDAESRGQAVMLGYVGPRQKALLAKTASALINPGRIGLIAVDARLMRLPIVTARGGLHAPEVEYLSEGENLFSTDPDGASLAKEIIKVIDNPASDFYPGDAPRIADMVTAFASGIHALLRTD